MDGHQGFLVGVAEDKYVSGCNNLGDKATPLHPLPLEQALCTNYLTDAHFFTYHAVNTGAALWPRMNKPLLAKLRAAGAEAMTQCMVFDIDNPGHTKWQDYCPVDGWLNWFHTQFLPAAPPWAASYCSLYTTRSGVRIVYALDRPIPVDDAENKHRWMVRMLVSAGLPVDKGCSDWTRCFRLPYVRRDGQPTTMDPSLRFFANWAARIDVTLLGEITRAEADTYVREIRQFDQPIPTREEAMSLLKEYSLQTGRQIAAAWVKAAKKKLVGRECYDALFNQGVLASEGQRDTTLHKYVGQVISLLFGQDKISPLHIYALFMEALDGLEPDQGTPDWHVKCWDHIGRIWSREEAKQDLEVQQQAEDLDTQQGLIERVIGGMQRWCKHPDLFRDKATAQQFALRHLIATVGQCHHVMTPDGKYDELSITTSSLIARIRILRMNGVIDTQRDSDNGGVSDVDARTILNAHSCVCRAIVAKPNVEGGYIDRIDTGDAELVLPTYQRNPDLVPEYSPHVDQWLKKFFGPYYFEGCEWIAWALAFDEGPICGLSIVGDPGIGKKLLTIGLSECLRIPALASAQDLVGDYQYGLMQSPFLIINEGWPKVKGGMHPADAFRCLVDGQPLMANRKFLAPVRVFNPPRIIFTANNTAVVSLLGDDRDLSPEDREALAIRLKHMHLNDEAAHWLRQLGGYAYTGKMGARWIAGDSGEPSDFIVARHFLWLHSIRGERERGRRFLVDGNANEDLMYEFRVGTGSNPLVIESILRMLEHSGPNWRLPHQAGRIWATSSMVLDYFRANLAATANQRLTQNQVTNAFKSLCISDPGKGSTTIGDIKARWWELDPDLLLSVARRDGRRSQVLDKIVEERRYTQVQR